MLVPIDHIPTILRLLGVSAAAMFGFSSIGAVYQSFHKKPASSVAQLAVVVGFCLVLGLLPNIWVALFTREVWTAKKKWRKNGLARGTWLTLLAIAYGMGVGCFLMVFFSF
ncbi:MAG: hypothetical protein JWP89_822 [Schlesneria sp.]|nr:hypothetical protein [Schlesneria sp.]